MSAYLVVRAVVAETDRRDFDDWYRTEHLPDAIKAFAAQRGWRAWSRTDPSVHYAFYEFTDAAYEFTDAAAAESVNTSPAIRALVAEFDARWGTRVTRTREILEVAG